MVRTTIFVKALRDRGRAAAVAAGALAALLAFAMATYSGIDLSLYTDLPEALRSIAGIPAGADVAALSYGVMFGTVGALTVAGVALSMGASTVAGEERDGTIGLLLAHPTSRTAVLLSKTASMGAVVALLAAALWAAGRVVPALLGVQIGSTHVGAMALHLAANALFYGLLAVAVGAWTGSRPLASGVAAGTMTLSFVAVGLLPLIGPVAGLVKVVPWYYFDGSDPLANGIGYGHLAVLLAGAAVLAAVAVVGVNRRDLKGRAAGRTLLDRLRDHPLTRRALDRFAGSTRVSGIWIKSFSEHQGVVAATAVLMFGVMGVLMGPMYTFVDDSLTEVGTQLPEALLALAGGGDLSTPEGWFRLETFGLMAPIAVILVAVVIGARALAGEEAGRTMGLLLANPVPRSRVVLHKAGSMALATVIVGAATFAGVTLGAVLAGLGMDVGNIAAVSLLLTLLGLVFGGLALLLGAATGRVATAVYGTVGAALTLHLGNAYLPLNEQLADLAKVSPFYYYLSADPLANGLPWGHTAVLAVLAAGLVAASVPLFQRRDLRTR